jgi:hypothetical protein
VTYDGGGVPAAIGSRRRKPGLPIDLPRWVVSARAAYTRRMGAGASTNRCAPTACGRSTCAAGYATTGRSCPPTRGPMTCPCRHSGRAWCARTAGFAGAFRRSELVALDVADLQETASRSSSAGRRPIRKATARRSPLRAVSRLAPSRRGCKLPASAEARYFALSPRGGRLGPQRLTDKSVCDLVKAYAERIGLKGRRLRG